VGGADGTAADLYGPRAAPLQNIVYGGAWALVSAMMEPGGVGDFRGHRVVERLVESTERLYRALFTTAVGYGLGTAIWALVIAPFNSYDHNLGRTLVVGVVVVGVASLAFVKRIVLLRLLRDRPELLLGFAALGVASMWADTGWRSSFYLFSYFVLALSAVAASVRWSLVCALILAVGLVAGLGLHGYSWTRLGQLHDQDGIVAATGGYFIAAYVYSVPVAWLGGYVARIHQILGDAPVVEESRTRDRTKSLSVREVQVTQLVAAGYSNDEIAGRLVISNRTVQSHVASALRKTQARNRAELGVLAVREGLVPLTEAAASAEAADDLGAPAAAR
jgi:DNA-binding CsgD family transcriptional regulator